eukprot:502507_1
MDWDLTQETTKIILFSLTSICVFICTPLSMYFANQLWQLNKAKVPYITKRHPKIVICHVIAFNIYSTIIRPVSDLQDIYEPTEGVNYYIPQLAQFLLIFVCVRLWLLYYDYQYELQTLDEKWQVEITKQQYGNKWTKKYRWMGKPKIITLIAFTFASCVVAVIVILGPKYIGYTQPVPALYVVFIIVMVIKIRACRDEFYIRKEFFVIMLTFAAYGIVYAAFVLPFTPEGSMIRLVVMNIFVTSACYIACFISTYWIIKQYEKQKELHVGSVELQTSPSMTQSSSQSRMSLEDIISKQDGFDLFAIHLVKEFAIENLAFVFEVMQIKNEAIHSKLISEDDVGLLVPVASERIQKIKRKQCQVKGINDLKENIKYIVDEYIYQGAEHCINISSFTRIAVLKTYNGLEQQNITDHVADVIDRNLHAFTGRTGVNEEDKELTLQYVTIFDKALDEIS